MPKPAKTLLGSTKVLPPDTTGHRAASGASPEA